MKSWHSETMCTILPRPGKVPSLQRIEGLDPGENIRQDGARREAVKDVDDEADSFRFLGVSMSAFRVTKPAVT